MLDFQIPKYGQFVMNHYSERYSFNAANFILMYQMLLSAKWKALNMCTNIDEARTLFYNELDEVFDAAVPKFRFKPNVSRYYPPWFYSQIIKYTQN